MSATNLVIQGLTFEVAERYAEGHVLTVNEANVLNQTFRENVRNNCAKLVKVAIEAADGEISESAYDDLKISVELKAEAYEFGVRAVASTAAGKDPVEKEAIRLAVIDIKDQIKSAGAAVKDYPAAQIKGAAVAAIEKHPIYLERARDEIKRRSEVAELALGDLMADLSQNSAEVDSAE